MDTYTPALIGGIVLGTSAALLLATLGRIAGISGIVWGAITASDRDWRWFFIIGLLGGGAISHAFLGAPLPADSGMPVWLAIVSGLLVGVGTRMGSGCTSGHGVCGLGRRSVRSLAATLTFMASGVLTVFLVRQVLGVWS